MPDREKVIKALECCGTGYYGDIVLKCYECLYGNGPASDCRYNLHQDALALLKEQEAKPMIENERGWNCPSCGMKLIGKTASGYPCDLIDLPEDEPIHFCPKCGQAVKWE